jgi:biotin---protein ligase
MIEELAADDKQRMEFMKACLVKLGLTVNHDEEDLPTLSPIFLSCLRPTLIKELIASWKKIATTENGEKYINDEIDRFHLVTRSRLSLETLSQALPSKLLQGEGTEKPSAIESHILLDYITITKELLIHDTGYPSSDDTPAFNHSSYYSNLLKYQTMSAETILTFGDYLLYGELMTSTNSLLEKNIRLLQELPTGFTAVATSQLAGRGRGSNVWLSPPGSLMFSTVIRHPLSLMQKAPVVFIQYLAALAIVEGIQSYDGTTYQDMPVRLKWPNDIYALSPSANGTTASTATLSRDQFVKIGGILVNSHYNARDFISVCGIGLNLSNDLPTTSVNALLPLLPSFDIGSPPLPLTSEKLLPSILTCFSALYTRFLDTGFDDYFLEKYYGHWLHADQIITLEDQEDASPTNRDIEVSDHLNNKQKKNKATKARIRGITSDHGLLIAEEVVEVSISTAARVATPTSTTTTTTHQPKQPEEQEQPKWQSTGKIWQLQSDSNSFDFFSGLIRRKL